MKIKKLFTLALTAALTISLAACSGVGGSLIDVHPGAALVDFHNSGQVVKVQLGVYAMGIQIHGQGHNIHIAGPLAVAKEGSLHPVRTGQQAQLRIRHAGGH